MQDFYIFLAYLLLQYSLVRVFSLTNVPQGYPVRRVLIGRWVDWKAFSTQRHILRLILSVPHISPVLTVYQEILTLLSCLHRLSNPILSIHQGQSDSSIVLKSAEMYPQPLSTVLPYWLFQYPYMFLNPTARLWQQTALIAVWRNIVKKLVFLIIPVIKSAFTMLQQLLTEIILQPLVI